MPSQNVKTCTHIKVTGIRCGSPALRGEHFCYFHQRMHRGVRTPPEARLHPIANLEDEEAIQSALMEVVNALLRNSIDPKRATLVLRALHIAVKNAHRVRFKLFADQMVKEIPEYPIPAANAESISVRVGADAFVRPGGEAAVTEADTSTTDAGKITAADVSHTDLGRATNSVVRTAAVSCSGGKEVSVRSTVPSTAPDLDLPAVAATPPKPLHPDPNFWERWEAGARELSRNFAQPIPSQTRTPEISPAQKKPPHTVKQLPTSTQRRIAARSRP